MKLSGNALLQPVKPTFNFLQRFLSALLIVSVFGIETASAAPPAAPTSLSGGSIPALTPEGLFEAALVYFIQQRMGNVLPLQLDPSLALPTVSNDQLPGGPFRGQPLALTADNVTKPLPPGDYEIPVMAYCTQYSVHRPGRNAAAVLAPVTGTQAQVLGNLLWKGTQAGITPSRLQTTAWAIQAGVPYNKLSKQSQGDIDALVPEYRSSLEQGFSLDAPIRQLYNDIIANPRKYIIEYKHAKGIKFPPDVAIPNMKIVAPSFDQIIAQLGPAGRAYVQAEADQRAIQQQLTDQQHSQESLILHQASTDPPLPPSQGPWTVRVPNVAYMRFVVHGGNMSSDNVMQIRVLPKGGSYDDATLRGPHLVYANYHQADPISLSYSVMELMGAGQLAAGAMTPAQNSKFHQRESQYSNASSGTLIAFPSIPAQDLIAVLPWIVGVGPMMMANNSAMTNSQSRTEAQSRTSSDICDSYPNSNTLDWPDLLAVARLDGDQWLQHGGAQRAVSDFCSLKGTDPENSNNGVIIKMTTTGTAVLRIRPENASSKDGQPTLQMYRGGNGNKPQKIRYDP